MKKILMLFAASLLFACNGGDKKREAKIQNVVQEKVADSNQVNVANNSKYIPVKTWVDDFKNFRSAVLTEDKAKLKTYFKFPIVATGNSSLWYLIQLSDAEWKKRKLKYGSKADFFYEEDLDRYLNLIFDPDFVKTITKIKTAKLLNEQHSESPIFAKGDYTYQMLVDLQADESNTLFLNMSFGNTSVDENGENISEGEHNNIYMFEVIDKKRIFFKGFTVAG
ncbi:MAG: hypothetical protein EOO96_04680 [Pedobacter sp.]|nr:MAG: hypothetical protein EOO96_04680 [Pedobacter sp.]